MWRLKGSFLQAAPLLYLSVWEESETFAKMFKSSNNRGHTLGNCVCS